MSAKSMYNAKEQLCKLFDEAIQGGIGIGDLEAINYLTGSIKNIMRINEMEESGYSYDGTWTANGRYSNGNYSNGNYSNDGRYSSGRHYVRGHYSNANEESMLAEHMERMMDNPSLSGNDKETLRKAMSMIRG